MATPLLLLLTLLGIYGSRVPCQPQQGLSCNSSNTLVPGSSPLVCECGHANQAGFRIVGGDNTDMNEYPWQVGLVQKRKKIPFCGGVILSSNTIISAAHCTCGMNVDTFDVVVAEHALSVDDGQAWFTVCKKTQHPKYNRLLHDNDLSIITLCTHLTFRREVSPVCLPTKPGPEYDNVMATVSGWGYLQLGGERPDKLMDILVKTLNNTECNKAYTGNITDDMICARGKGKDACKGDSGGPLITKEAGGYYSLIGVVSWGKNCASAVYPGVYARVTENISWIKENIQGTTCLPPEKEETDDNEYDEKEYDIKEYDNREYDEKECEEKEYDEKKYDDNEYDENKEGSIPYPQWVVT